MNWSKDYEIGIKIVDQQHEKLLNMINKLEGSMGKENVLKVMGDILRGLVDYVKFHFQDEEKVMKRIAYPELERHKKLHEELVRQVTEILIKIKKGEVITAHELMGFLQRWLLDHIMAEDKKIGEFFFA